MLQDNKQILLATGPIEDHPFENDFDDWFWLLLIGAKTSVIFQKGWARSVLKDPLWWEIRFISKNAGRKLPEVPVYNLTC